jgi:hypothetical protein
MPAVTTDPARDLESAIEQLSFKTRSAMLEAVRCPATRIIAGEYAGPGGGVCPLLAAHRRGGRAHDESTASSPFAAAWDRFTATPTGAPRVVGARERGVLEAMLARSLERERRPRPGDLDRSRELAGRPGWAWLGVYRRYDAYRIAVAAALEAEAGRGAGGDDPGRPKARTLVAA